MRFTSALSILAAWALIVSPALRAEPSVPADLLPLAREGKEHFERGRYTEAETAYREILARAPMNPYALYNLGVVLFRAGKLEAAEKAMRDAMAVLPEDAACYRILGTIYTALDKLDEAVVALTKALALDPKDAAAHFQFGEVALRKGWAELAFKELETAGTLDPSYREQPGALDRGVGDFLTPLEKERRQNPKLDLSPNGPVLSR